MTQVAAIPSATSHSTRAWARVFLGSTVSVGSLAYLLWQVHWPQFDDALAAIPVPALVVAFAALLLSVVLAALRLIILGRYVGHKIAFPGALAAVCLGQLASLFLFQIFGQLLVRGAVLKRSGVPAGTAVYLTLYERLIALVLLLAFASLGALSIFGSIKIDFQSGGRDFVAIVVGGLFVLSFCIILAWGALFRSAWDRVEPGFIARTFLNAAVTVSIQVCTLVAFVVLASAIAPTIGLGRIAAASTIVMFAAAFPISMAGWGVRELGAVFALGAIGLPQSQALLVGLVVGVLSLLTNVLVGFSSSLFLARPRQPISPTKPHNNPMVTLGIVVPILAAMAIFFQVHVPLAGNETNVNLADPMALLGGGLFLLLALQGRPQWRLDHMHLFLGLMSAAIVLAFIRGLYTVGWTQWAATRVFGWLLILGYGGAGALIVRTAQSHGLKILIRTIVSSAVAIVAFYLVCMAFQTVNIDPFRVPARVAGFAVDPNAFAFQLLVSLALSLGCLEGWKYRGNMLILLTIGIGLTGSRSGFIGFSVLVAVYILLRRTMDFAVLRKILVGIGALIGIRLLLGALTSLQPQLSSVPFGEERLGSTTEHLSTVVSGLRLFWEHPFIGNGLGYFMATFWTNPGDYHHPIDSTAVSLLAETGILGLSAFVLPFLALLFGEVRRGRSAQDNVAVSIVLSLAAFAAMGIFYDLLYQRLLWFVLGALIASDAKEHRMVTPVSTA